MTGADPQNSERGPKKLSREPPRVDHETHARARECTRGYARQRGRVQIRLKKSQETLSEGNELTFKILKAVLASINKNQLNTSSFEHSGYAF